MTEQKHKWYHEIVAWAGGARVEERYYKNENWEQSEHPDWNNNYFEFRLHDPYREFREAEERGEVVEYLRGDGTWGRPRDGYKILEFNGPASNYRIARPEPKPGVSVHQAYEWLDAAANEWQRLLNIRDGVSTVDDAIEELMSDISRYQKAKPEPEEEELYVLVSKYDGALAPLFKAGAELERLRKTKPLLEKVWGKTRIEKLKFIE